MLYHSLRIIFLFGICLAAKSVFSQEVGSIKNEEATRKERQIFITWGYNRAYYNRSDVHFKGEGYDFTLKDARAEDIPEKFDASIYLNPTMFTIPQFNFRVGYYFRKNTAISMGWDHMKYHLVPTQLVTIDGFIDPDKYPFPGYSGEFHNDLILYKSSFMNYHHSDGFNFIRVALEQRLPFWSSANGNHVLAMNASVSLGTMMPWTDFTFFGEAHRNKLHFAGYGASLQAGFRYEIAKYFFLQIAAQVGWSNLTDIMLEDELPSRAHQKITFIERSWAIGGYIPIGKSKGVTSEN